MPRKKQADAGRSKSYSFVAELERMTGDFAWHYVEFPYYVEQEFGTRGRVRVKCLLNGVPADRALMPTKSGFHMLILGGEIRRSAKVKKAGDKVHVELWLDPEPDRIDIPEELSETLEFMPEMKVRWDKLTPGLQRSMCYWVESAKTTATKAKRVAELLRRMESEDGVFGGRKLPK